MELTAAPRSCKSAAARSGDLLTILSQRVKCPTALVFAGVFVHMGNRYEAGVAEWDEQIRSAVADLAVDLSAVGLSAVDLSDSPTTRETTMPNIKRLRLPSPLKVRRPAPEKEFGTRLRALRTEKGYSQMDLARAAGVHHTYVSSCERGLRNVSLEIIYKLAKGLGVAPSELLKPEPSNR